MKIKEKKLPFDRYFKDEEDAAFIRRFSYPDVSLYDFIVERCSVDGLDCKISLEASGDILINGAAGETERQVNELVREYYETYPLHITRMFGSYVLLAKENGRLRAVHATPIPIKYCPLMVQLLKEVGGATAEALLDNLDTSTSSNQRKLMCDIINEVVIDGGYFDTSRPLNSCEANVLFGASEIIYSAFTDGLVDAAVIVSNNLGTIITTTASATQGAVKRMTGLFYTSPSKELMNIAVDAVIIPVFPYTAEIDQIAGVRAAIERGFQKIAVTLASYDNSLLEEIHALEAQSGATIYKLGLCSTGIPMETAKQMKKYADIIWSCASKAVRMEIEPNAVAQVGLKIPVHIMTPAGWDLVKSHLQKRPCDTDLDAVQIIAGEEKPIFVNNNGVITKIKKADVLGCVDCPHPCI